MSKKERFRASKLSELDPVAHRHRTILNEGVKPLHRLSNVLKTQVFNNRGQVQGAPERAQARNIRKETDETGFGSW